METFSRGTLAPEWVTGFCEAAASFTYSRSGRQLALYFAIKLPAADQPLVEDLQAFFSVGRIYDVGRSSYFRVSRRDELMRILDHFDSHPLRSSKRDVYDVWRQMVVAKQDFRHPDRTRLDELATQIKALR